MNRIDLGFLNVKQIKRVVAEVAKSKLNVIEMAIFKLQDNLNVVLSFMSRTEKELFDEDSLSLIEDLKKLR